MCVCVNWPDDPAPPRRHHPGWACSRPARCWRDLRAARQRAQTARICWPCRSRLHQHALGACRPQPGRRQLPKQRQQRAQRSWACLCGESIKTCHSFLWLVLSRVSNLMYVSFFELMLTKTILTLINWIHFVFEKNIIFTFYYTRVRPQRDYSFLGRPLIVATKTIE